MKVTTETRLLSPNHYENESWIINTAYIEGWIARVLEGHHLTSVWDMGALFPKAINFATITDAVVAGVVTWY